MLALYTGMCGLRSPLVLPFRWRREREKNIGFSLLMLYKNLTFIREFQTGACDFLNRNGFC